MFHSVYNILLQKPVGKSPLGRPGRRGGDNIRMDLMETGLEGADWMHLAHDRDQWRDLVNIVRNIWIP
jgi:hypothetical protein